MVDDLDRVAVRIAEVARSGAVAVCPRLRRDRDASALQERRPSIDIVCGPDDEAEMIERATGRRQRRRIILDGDHHVGRAVQREVVDPRRQVHVVGIGLPLDRESQQIDVEALHRVQIVDAAAPGGAAPRDRDGQTRCNEKCPMKMRTA